MRIITLACCAATLWISLPQAFGFDLTYSGTAINNSPDMRGNGSIIAGTFRPGFNPLTYKYVYGIDSVGNMSSPNLTRAIADGVFRPIGSLQPIFLSTSEFSGSGTATGIEGSQIYLFGFSNPVPDKANYLFLATSSSPNWKAPADNGTAIHLNSTEANQFVFGSKFGDLLVMNTLPTPEPATWTLIGFGALLLPVMRFTKPRVQS